MKKYKRRKKRKISILIITLLIVSISLIGIYFNKDKIFISTLNNTEEEVKEPVIEEIKEEYYKATMIMAGDNLIHSSVYKDALIGNNNYDFRKMYDLIKPIVSQYDIAYYNQETILGGKELGVDD